MYKCICICIRIRIRICICVCIYIYIYLHIYIYMCILCIFICIFMFIFICIWEKKYSNSPAWINAILGIVVPILTITIQNNNVARVFWCLFMALNIDRIWEQLLLSMFGRAKPWRWHDCFACMFHRTAHLPSSLQIPTFSPGWFKIERKPCFSYQNCWSPRKLIWIPMTSTHFFLPPPTLHSPPGSASEEHVKANAEQ